MADLIVYTIIISFTVIIGFFVHSLSKSGSLAAAGVGVSVALALEWKGLLVLGVFFVSSSFWSKYKRASKALFEEKHEKGSRRDWQQVMANGGIAALSCLVFYITDNHLWVLAFGISIAASNSDTWASEIGALSKKHPLFIGNFKRVEKGTSGAISFIGTMASVGGALLIALLCHYLFNLSINEALLIFCAGFLGNVVDTLVGAYLQAVYRCKKCQSLTEKKIHCRRPTQLFRGVAMINNDVVNVFSNFISVLIGSLMFLYLL